MTTAVLFLPPFVFFPVTTDEDSPVPPAPPSLPASFSALSFSACPDMNSRREGDRRQHNFTSSTETVVRLACLHVTIQNQEYTLDKTYHYSGIEVDIQCHAWPHVSNRLYNNIVNCIP